MITGCYTLSRPETRWVFGDCAKGFWTLASPVIHPICHHDYSIYSSFPESCSPSRFMFPNFVLFHVSVLLCIFVPLVLFLFPEPRPDICPILGTLTWFPLILIHSEPHVCSSVWNQHWLSLELLIWTSEPSSVSCPKFEDSRRLVAQHISWSWVLAKHIEPQYALSSILAHNTGRLSYNK